MKVAIEQVFDGSIDQVAIGGAYDATKINRGQHTGQFNLGPNNIDKFIGPAPVGIANFGQSSLAIPSLLIDVVKITDDLFWIFGADSSGASATRRVQLWTFIPSTNTYTLAGAIICTFPTAGNRSYRGFNVILENYTTGTVGVSGTAVTGVGSAWNTDRLSVGSRIGFGSTNPNQITQWFQISAIGSDTSITLTSSAGTISSGTPYVIQDLMLAHLVQNSTVPTDGGLFITKGLQFADFINPATTIPAATTVDRIKATYWLKEAATVIITGGAGCATAARDSWTQQYLYAATDSLIRILRFNIRAALTPTSGAFVLTGTNIFISPFLTVAPTGTIASNANLKIATLQHGSAKGVQSLYMFTSTRILRIPIANLINTGGSGSDNFIADFMFEVVPGNTETNVGISSIATFDIDESLDKIIFAGGSNTTSLYITDYYTGGQQIDRRANHVSSQMISTLRDTDSPIYVHSIAGQAPFIFAKYGWLFWLYSTSATANLNALSAYPLAADLEFQDKVNNRVILPKITFDETPEKLYRVTTTSVGNLGDHRMGISPDLYKLQVRTAGIDDNSGRWTDVTDNGDLSGLGTPSSIQFALQFRTAGVVMLPARVLSLALIYETEDILPPQYRWNYSDFNTSNGTFAWIQSTLFSTSIGTHTINIYRSDTNALVLTQASTSTTNGTFEYWNGSAWVAGLGTDVVGTRRRFVPSGSLPGSVDLYAKITIA